MEIALKSSPLYKGTVLGAAARPGPLLTSMANIYLAKGMPEECLKCCEKAVDWGRRCGMTEERAQAHRQFGLIHLALDRKADALPHLRDAAKFFAQLEDASEEAIMQRSAATILEAIGDLPGAELAWKRVLDLGDQMADPRLRLEALEALGRLSRRHGQAASLALGRYVDALELAIQLEDAPKQADLHNTIGVVHWTAGEHEAALASYQHGLEICHRLGDRTHAALMLNSIGVTLHKLGRLDEAQSILDQALEVQRAIGNRTLEGHALAAAGDIEFDRRRYEEALSLYARSLEIRRDLGDTKGEGWMLQRLARANQAIGKHARRPRVRCDKRLRLLSGTATAIWRRLVARSRPDELRSTR